MRKNVDLLLVAVVFLFAILPLSGGCGNAKNKPRPVSGKVTFQGSPVTEGMIRFSNSQAGVDMTAALKSDGAYEVRTAKGAGLPEGTYRVAVMPPQIEVPLGPIRVQPKPPMYSNIPEKYRDPATSGLTVTVKSDMGDFNVDMQQENCKVH